jgi:hypothetical protein
MTSLDRIYQRNLTPSQARHYGRLCEHNGNRHGAVLYADVAEALEAAQRIRSVMRLQGYICPTCGNTGRLDDIPCFHCSA